MATEWESAAQAELEASAREEKVSAFLSSGYATQVAELALAAYWDHLQAKLKAEKLGRHIRIDTIADRLSKSELKGMYSDQDTALAEADAHFRVAADYASIAGAVELVKADRSVQA